jgi:hypothetical protein
MKEEMDTPNGHMKWTLTSHLDHERRNGHQMDTQKLHQKNTTLRIPFHLECVEVNEEWRCVGNDSITPINNTFTTKLERNDSQGTLKEYTNSTWRSKRNILDFSSKIDLKLLGF